MQRSILRAAGGLSSQLTFSPTMARRHEREESSRSRVLLLRIENVLGGIRLTRMGPSQQSGWPTQRVERAPRSGRFFSNVLFLDLPSDFRPLSDTSSCFRRCRLLPAMCVCLFGVLGYVCTHVCVYVCVCMYVRMDVCMYVCVYVCMCVCNLSGPPSQKHLHTRLKDACA